MLALGRGVLFAGVVLETERDPMRMMTKIGAGVIASLLATATTADAATKGGARMVNVVDDDGHGSPRDCDSARPALRSIQDAIDAGAAGSAFGDPNRVLVCPGTYRGPLRVDGGMAAVSLEAVTAVRPIIEPAGDTPGSDSLIEVTTNRLRIAGFRLRPGGAPGAGCSQPDRVLIRAAFGEVVVLDSRLGPDPNQASSCTRYGHGIVVEGDGGSPGFFGSARIHGSTIAGFGEQGIEIFGPSEATIVGNRFQPRTRPASSTDDVRGIHFQQDPTLDGPPYLEISGNVFDAREPSGRFTAVSGWTPDAVTIDDNVITGATVGIRVGAVGGSIRGNTLGGRGRDAWPGNGIGLRDATGDLSITGNVVTRFGGSGIRVVATDGADIVANDFRGNRGTDCVDATTGAGDAGTANRWQWNQGYESQPAGICT